jgi:serine/threonine protein kinase
MNTDKNRIRQYLIVLFAFVAGTAVGYLISYISNLQPSLIPLASSVLGLFVAFSVPLWQARFVNAPSLSVEISAIKRTVSDEALISLDDYPELSLLLPFRSREDLYGRIIYRDLPLRYLGASGSWSVSLSELDQLMASAKQLMRDLPSQIEERKKDLEKVKELSPATFTKYESDRLNEPLHPEIDYDPDDREKSLEEFRHVYQKRLEDLEKRNADYQTNIPPAERRTEQLRNELINNRSIFTVSASLINSGRSNTAIKVPGLLRVSIGEGNYIDLKLTLKDFENKSEISANGTRIVVFESPEVSSLPEEDRKLINTYWGQSVNARLLLEDIHSKIYTSNRIAFAEGLYQKIIYDRLARQASIETYPN